MRRISTALLIASFGAITGSANLHAQSGNAKPNYPDQQLYDSLLKGIALTDSQKIKVESIARGYLELRHDNDARLSGAPRDTIRSFVRELREKQAADLRRVLTPAQQKKFDENRNLRSI